MPQAKASTAKTTYHASAATSPGSSTALFKEEHYTGETPMEIYTVDIVENGASSTVSLTSEQRGPANTKTLNSGMSKIQIQSPKVAAIAERAIHKALENGLSDDEGQRLAILSKAMREYGADGDYSNADIRAIRKVAKHQGLDR